MHENDIFEMKPVDTKFYYVLCQKHAEGQHLTLFFGENGERATQDGLQNEMEKHQLIVDSVEEWQSMAFMGPDGPLDDVRFHSHIATYYATPA